MKTLTYKDWPDFQRRYVSRYLDLPKDRRESFVFRGQADATWPLLATLDRERTFADDTERDAFYKLLQDEFRRESFTITSSPPTLPDGDAFDLLARHHGLPSPIMDWTSSLFVALHFAFATTPDPRCDDASIWVCDRNRFEFSGSGIDYIDNVDLLRFNPRALRQRGVFMRVGTAKPPLSSLLGPALTQLMIPRDCQDTVLKHLDEMLITSTSLFDDLDGAARTVRSRQRRTGGG